MDSHPSRRNLLSALGATATAVSFAGCSESSPSNNNTNTNNTDTPTQNTPSNPFFKTVSVSENGDVVELTVDQSELDADVFEVALVSDTGDLIESNPIAGMEDTVTYMLVRSGRATNGTNHLKAFDRDGNLITEQEITLTYGLSVTDVALDDETIVKENGATAQWVFTFENPGNSAAQLSRFFTPEGAASDSNYYSPADSDNSDRIYINEPTAYKAYLHVFKSRNDAQPIEEAINANTTLEIPIRISLNNGNDIYEFVVTATAIGKVMKDPANDSYDDDLYYPSEVTVDIASQPEHIESK